MKKLFLAAILLPTLAFADEAPATPASPPQQTQDPTVPVLLQLLHHAQDREALATVQAARAEEKVRTLEANNKTPLPPGVKLPEKQAPAAPPAPPKEPRSNEAHPDKAQVK